MKLSPKSDRMMMSDMTKTLLALISESMMMPPRFPNTDATVRRIASDGTSDTSDVLRRYPSMIDTKSKNVMSGRKTLNIRIADDNPDAFVL